jgi:sigma-B regulation protein RsbU (phosphoserine phosphatase)
MLGGKMTTREKINENPWQVIRLLFRHKLGVLTIGANLFGACVVTSYFAFFDQALQNEEIKGTFITTAIMFICLVIIARVFSRRWGKNLDRYIQLKLSDQNIDPQLQARAQQKILNLPYISSLISLFTWCAAAITMSIYSSLTAGQGSPAIEFVDALRVFVGVIIAGIVVCVIIFFSVEAFCRKIWPHFFPDGGLIKTPGTFRLRLRIRMLAIFVLASILPLVLMAVLSYNKARMMLFMEPSVVIQSLLYLTAFLLAVTLAMALILSHLFSTSIVNPVSRMEKAMAKVEKADFTAAVPVESNDELGALAEHFNQMTEGLKERYQLRRSLDLAREVQQNLLPKENPSAEGLDIAGKSIYCDETGGDYFDFIDTGDSEPKKIGIVVGDVSEHGIPSALLMATARAFLRQRSALAGSIARVVSDVNRQLTRDVEETGRFMTLFYLLIDLPNRSLHWVRAGHDAAILYDPILDRIEELSGQGIALGVKKDWPYQEYKKTGLAKGQIILLSTDGLWETRNPQGDMFGKKSIYDIIRRNSSASAPELIDIFIAELDRFRRNRQPADDITLVIVKVKEEL